MGRQGRYRKTLRFRTKTLGSHSLTGEVTCPSEPQCLPKNKGTLKGFQEEYLRNNVKCSKVLLNCKAALSFSLQGSDSLILL